MSSGSHPQLVTIAYWFQPMLIVASQCYTQLQKYGSTTTINDVDPNDFIMLMCIEAKRCSCDDHFIVIYNFITNISIAFVVKKYFVWNFIWKRHCCLVCQSVTSMCQTRAINRQSLSGPPTPTSLIGRLRSRDFVQCTQQLLTDEMEIHVFTENIYVLQISALHGLYAELANDKWVMHCQGHILHVEAIITLIAQWTLLYAMTESGLFTFWQCQRENGGSVSKSWPPPGLNFSQAFLVTDDDSLDSLHAGRYRNIAG